jgi:R3H domain
MLSTSSPSLSLMPSQAMNSQTQQQQQPSATSTASSSNNRSRNRRGPNKSNNASRNGNNNGAAATSTNSTSPAAAVATDAPAHTTAGSTTAAAAPPVGNGGRRRNKPKRKNKNPTAATVTNSNNNNEPPAVSAGTDDGSASSPPSPGPNDTNNNTASNSKKKKNRSKRNKNPNKKNDSEQSSLLYPWRRHIPDDTVDPITLDPLHTLPYPPFALHAEAPYDPIEEWPVPEEADDSNERRKKLEQERQARILQEQWGHKTLGSNQEEISSNDKNIENKKHIHLYDGRALAYYMVSQLQFIDPLNRRDLTRDELTCLDRYLRRHAHIISNHHHHQQGNSNSNKKNRNNRQQQHHANDLNVTEAYDAKGMTLSSAGAAAHTDAGRAAIRAAMLQQEASVLLNALFGGGVGVGGNTANATNNDSDNNDGNALFRQYQAHQQQEHSRQHHAATTSGRNDGHDWRDETGIHGNARGMLIIDDDLNPGLRGDALEFVPSSSSSSNNYSALAYSASHIAQRYGHAARQQAHEFPSLSSTSTASAAATAPDTTDSNNSSRKTLPKAKTLSRIGGVVKKTTEDERQRQWEAREDARRRALLSNLTFNPVATMGGASVSATGGGDDMNSITPLAASSYPSEAQLERNRAFAEALGVTPATARLPVNSGWARPVNNTDAAPPAVDEFGNELGVTIYPDALILQARDRMGLLTKLEKKWKAFLADDKAASLPLNTMDRPTRTFVHHYGDFWKLQTESFDAEPKRYIHCVKLRDTGMPWPLLSQAVREWRGPQPFLASLHLQPITATAATATLPSSASDHNLQQTAGQSTSGRRRELPDPPDRTPLPLKPRSATVTDLSSAASSTTTSVGMAGAPTRTMVGEAATNTRFDVLLTTSSMEAKRERPKLDLQKRSLPLELPPFDPMTAAAADSAGSFDIQEELKRTKERAAEKAARERLAAEQKRLALEAAFASDDEDSDGGNNNRNNRKKPGAASAFGDSDDEWTEQEPVFTGNDDEGF